MGQLYESEYFDQVPQDVTVLDNGLFNSTVIDNVPYSGTPPFNGNHGSTGQDPQGDSPFKNLSTVSIGEGLGGFLKGFGGFGVSVRPNSSSPNQRPSNAVQNGQLAAMLQNPVMLMGIGLIVYLVVKK